MRTSAIHQRVVDFLKAFRPFSDLPAEALAELAAGGRVLFREKGDIIFEEGTPQRGFVYVIQQGGARLSFREESGGEKLADLRGVGEILGLARETADGRYFRTARAVEDTILYALETGAFEAACAASSPAAEFLAILLDTEPNRIQEPSAEAWFEESATAQGWFGGVRTCSPDLAVREVARFLAEGEADALLVADSAGRPIGICTGRDLLKRVATGEVGLDAPVRRIMQTPVWTIAPHTPVGRSLVEMMRRGIRHVCVTEDGTTSTRAVEVVSEDALMLRSGNNPLALIRAIRRAGDLNALRAVRDRADVLLERGLRSHADVDGYCAIMAEIDRAVIRRVVDWAGGGADVLLLGAAGRKEKLARTAFGFAAVVADDAPETLAAGRQFLARVRADLARCGFGQGAPGKDHDCRSAVSWAAHLERCVREPVEQGVHQWLAFFDFDPVEPGPLASDLRRTFDRAVAASDRFRALLVNDAAAHLPPLTFFEGRVVDEAGQPADRLDLNDRAFWAVSDLARVLALEAGGGPPTSTLDRLEAARLRLPEAAEVLSEAALAVRVVLFQRARNAFRTGGSGSVLAAASLSPTDQAWLKFSFGAIKRLVDFMLARYGLA